MTSSTPPVSYRLNPRLDVPSLAARFAADRRVRIRDLLLPSSVDGLRAELDAETAWHQVINSDAGIYELDRAARSAMSVEKMRALDAAVHDRARAGFQFRYEAIRVPDEDADRAARGGALTGFAQWLSNGEARALLRTVTGKTEIDFADAQATAFSPGDFLTGHDDKVDGKARQAAYVLGLTPTWRLEWGGLLLFHGDDGDSVSGRVPGFNTLDLFDVPIMHSVSLVAPAAPCRRLSVTGWLRSRG